MPVYHSKFVVGAENVRMELIGNMALLPLRTNIKGPAPKMLEPGDDIIDEALLYFKPNIFFRNFEIRGPADRTLIYLFLYITECLKRLQRCQPKKIQAQKELLTLALDSSRQLPIPGDASFPFPGMFKGPTNAQEEEQMRAFLQQLRQELGARLVDRVFPDPEGPPLKWWLCFSRRRFMEKSLTQTM